jgi:hypothetical protein
MIETEISLVYENNQLEIETLFPVLSEVKGFLCRIGYACGDTDMTEPDYRGTPETAKLQVMDNDFDRLFELLKRAIVAAGHKFTVDSVDGILEEDTGSIQVKIYLNDIIANQDWSEWKGLGLDRNENGNQ